MSKDVVIVAYGRSAMCKSRKGKLAAAHPVDYAAQVLKGVLAKVPQLDPADIEDVIMGCAVHHNRTSMNMARSVALRAGLPDSVCGQTINRFCSSSLQAISTAANMLAAGQGDVIVAGGAEDMTGTYAPYPMEMMEPWLVENRPGAYIPMGLTAEKVAEKYDVSREAMEQLAVESHAKADAAQKAGKLAKCIIPVTVKDPEGNDVTILEDEGIRPGTSMEGLATLKPCFIPETGRVTAATCSQTTDAAAFVVLMTAQKAAELNITPIAKLVGFAVGGCDGEIMGIGPTVAVPKLMNRIGMSVDDMDVIELNEAFAAQAIPCMDILGMDKEKVNPYGGAMALGHPMGATGAILTCKVLDYLADTDGKYGLVTMCIGGGMGAAGVFEKL